MMHEKDFKENALQWMIDGMNQSRSRERAGTQMTLGELIEVLEGTSGDVRVTNLCAGHSYRGYYSDLAFSREAGTRPASELLQECRSIMGRALRGYKGGDFVMGEFTPVWVAEYGCCGERLMSFDGGKAVTAPEGEDQ